MSGGRSSGSGSERRGLGTWRPPGERAPNACSWWACPLCSCCCYVSYALTSLMFLLLLKRRPCCALVRTRMTKAASIAVAAYRRSSRAVLRAHWLLE